MHYFLFNNLKLITMISLTAIYICLILSLLLAYAWDSKNTLNLLIKIGLIILVGYFGQELYNYYNAPEPVIVMEEAEEEIDFYKDDAFEQANKLASAFVPEVESIEVCYGIDYIYCATVFYNAFEETYKVYLDEIEEDDGMAPNLETQEFEAIKHVIVDYFYKKLLR
jgi:hypothetical protein